MVWVKSSKVMPHCITIDLFSWEREGNSYIPTLVKTLKTSQTAFSDHKSLQHTCLDTQCVCDTLQNCPLLQNYMYILNKFCTFPVTEGKKICTSISVHNPKQRTHSKSKETHEFPAGPHPESHEFLSPQNYS